MQYIENFVEGHHAGKLFSLLLALNVTWAYL